MTSFLDKKLVQRFPERYWKEGWALSHYSKDGVRTELGQLIYRAKYQTHIEGNLSERQDAGNHILDTVKDFIRQKYPYSSRPFDAAVRPPSNLNKIFDLTGYIASNLSEGGIRDWSEQIIKTRDLSNMKSLVAKQRQVELDGAYEFKISDHTRYTNGILIVDDVLDTGSTSREICKVLDRVFPGVPRYFIAVTYLLDQR